MLTLSDNGQKNLGQNTGCGSEVESTGENSLGGVMSVGYRGLRWCAGCASRFGVWGDLGVEEVIDGRIRQIYCARP